MQDRWQPLTDALTEVMRAHAPEWTDRNDPDPGVTILEVFAYLAEDLRLHTAPSNERVAAAARAIGALEGLIAAASPSVSSQGTEVWSGNTRPNYFPGRLLSAADLRDEQQFHVGKHRRHVRLLHGWGVVNGLAVTVTSDGTSVTVAPGVAVDPLGNEIVLGDFVATTPPYGTTSSAWVVLEYAERPIDLMPIAGDEPQASRIEEGCRVMVTTSPSGSGITLARLVEEAAGWSVDRTFTPPRTR